jgi:hypothetical protein
VTGVQFVVTLEKNIKKLNEILKNKVKVKTEPDVRQIVTFDFDGWR